MIWQPNSYYIGELGGMHWTLQLTHAEKNHWVVRNGGLVLNRECGWEYEPMPSSREADFIARTRFTLDEASTLGLKAWEGRNTWMRLNATTQETDK